MNKDCPSCGANVLVERNGRSKMRTSILVLHKSGEVETNCPSCKIALILPCVVDPQAELKKAQTPVNKRFVIKVDSAPKSKA